MSNNDSIDEETKRILAEVSSDDSKESTKDDDKDKNKAKTWYEKDEDGNEVETNDRDTPDIEW